MRAAKTAPEAMVTAVTIARKIAKVPAVVGVCDGFVGNRMLAKRGSRPKSCCSKARCRSRSTP